jgi:hypothetical protein
MVTPLLVAAVVESVWLALPEPGAVQASAATASARHTTIKFRDKSLVIMFCLSSGW